MTGRQLKELRERMIQRVTELYHSVHRDVTDVRQRNEFMQEEPPRDEGDESLRVQVDDLKFSLVESDARLAQAIQGALERMARGEYGECIDCGSEIEWDRLRAVPWTPRCIDCQEALESENRERPSTF